MPLFCRSLLIILLFGAVIASVLMLAPFHLQAVSAFLMGINCAAFFACAIDKAAAGRADPSKRIPELSLLTSGLLGGALGLYLGMVLFRHKTKKSSFRTLVLIMFFLELLLLFIWLGATERRF